MGPYVINLCASMTPMALTRPTAPELARFTFFVSRRREEGRERFRLHMGYFQTREEAEQLLALIRDLYPAAWVGEAPGKRLAARESAKGAPSARPVAATGAAVGNTPATRATDAKAAAGASPARPNATAANARKAPAAAGRAAAAPKPGSPAPAAAHGASTPTPAARPAVSANAERRSVAKVPPSNVREVIASLDAPSTTVAPTSAAPAARTPAPPSVTEPQVQHPAGGRSAPVDTGGAVVPGAAGGRADELSDSQVLRILEARRASATGQPTPGARVGASDIRMLNPDDTQTWRDIRSQILRDAAVHFAVQLAWSVTPIDLERIPGLAIFNAYTLYKVEGNREGRRWYGLRLGFFSDAVAARQVALYVRSEFATVAVVPVSAKERTDAMQVGAIELPRRGPAASTPAAEDEIELIDEAVDAALSARDRAPVAESVSPTAPERDAQTAAPAPTSLATPVRRSGRPRGTPQTLEETLEILGASQLSIDDGKGVRLDLGSSTGGTRRGARAAARNTTFSKLLDRLTEKLRK
jgi:hypothetical protein